MSEKNKNNDDATLVANALTFTGGVLGSGAGPAGVIVGAACGRILAAITNPPSEND